MKKILTLFCFIIISKASIAQKDSLAFNPQGKYIYYKAVNLDKFTADTLYYRATYFLSHNYNKNTLKLTAADDKSKMLSALVMIPVFKKNTLAKHQDGQIACKLIVELKDAKYRYWLTDFMLTPYNRDRYNNYVPDNARAIPLELAGKQLSSKDMDDYLDQVVVFSLQFGNRLHSFLMQGNVVKKDAPKKVITIEKW